MTRSAPSAGQHDWRCTRRALPRACAVRGAKGELSEQVREGIAAWARALRDASVGVPLLLTSRVPVGLAGEHVVAVAPLSPEHSVALLRARLSERSAAWVADSDEGQLANLARRQWCGGPAQSVARKRGSASAVPRHAVVGMRSGAAVASEAHALGLLGRGPLPFLAVLFLTRLLSATSHHLQAEAV